MGNTMMNRLVFQPPAPTYQLPAPNPPRRSLATLQLPEDPTEEEENDDDDDDVENEHFCLPITMNSVTHPKTQTQSQSHPVSPSSSYCTTLKIPQYSISNPNFTPSTSNPFLYSYHKSISFVGVPTPSPHTNGTIATLFFAHPRSRGVTIIFSHGNAEDLGTCAPNLLELSRVLCVNVVGYDYRGYGQSAFCNNTNISESSVDEDLQSVFAHVVLNNKISPR